MEELTKTQIVLLTLLVSFVTSIATGIVTVSLMEGNVSGGVTQTVNRVVERTIERVVTDNKGQPAGSTITKEVVVKEENLVPESIEKVSPSIVRFKRNVVGSTTSTLETISLGTIIHKDGVVISDQDGFTEGVTYMGYLSDNTEAKFRAVKIVNGLTYLKLTTETKKDLPVAKLSDSDQVKLGQTTILISGSDRDLISIGVISMIREDENGSKVGFETSLPDTNLFGGPVFNVFGEIIGVRSSSAGSGSVTSSNSIKINLAEVLRMQ